MKLSFPVSLISGILIISASIITLAFPVTYTQALVAKFYTGVSIPTSPPVLVSIIALIFGLIIMYGSTMLRKAGKENTGMALVMIFSLINMVIIGVGSAISILGSVLGIAGSILAYLKK